MRDRALIAPKVWLVGMTAVLILSCGLLPSVTPTPVTEALQVDYLYTSNLMTILYPLYGSTLDDFAIITITNPRIPR
jgi:hypothetical protein